MNRWNCFSLLAPLTRRTRGALFGLVLGLSTGLPTLAQSPQHRIPDTAAFAFMRVTQAPELLLDDAAARLSPGARIYSPEKRLVLSASLSGQSVPVRYRLDADGQVIEVWMLRPDELPAFAGIRTNWATRPEQRP